MPLKRLKTLSQAEIDEIYSRPKFNQLDREEHFVLDAEIKKELKKLGKVEVKIYFILLIGYFRAKPVVPVFELNDVRKDVRFICKSFFPW